MDVLHLRAGPDGGRWEFGKEAELMRAVIPGASGLSAIHHRDAEGTFWDPASIALSSAPQRQVHRLLRSCMKKAPKGLG
jgi:hypothetical protein